ncbi:MAG: oligosaccharide flippase family protein [Anaerolineaceae bacterium]|nr:oligosaccharide flippase family protein [Anaerolineaceae bacterium]
MQRIRGLLERHSFVRSVVIVAGGATFAQGLALLVSPILTRIYTPDDLGVFGTFVSLFSILIAINSLSYELAIPLPETDEIASNLPLLAMFALCVTTVIFSLIIGLWGAPIADLIKIPTVIPYLWVLPVSLFAAGVYQIAQYWIIRKQNFTPISVARIFQSFGTVGTQVIAGLLQGGVFGLLAGHALGYVSGGATSMIYAWKSYKATLVQFDRAALIQAAARYRRFPLFTNWSRLINVSGAMLPPLLITAIYGTQIGGWFVLGQRMIVIPLSLIGNAIAQVYLGTASQLRYENPKALLRLFNKVGLRLTLVGGLPTLILWAAGPTLFKSVFGAEWQTAGEYMQLLAPALWTQFIISPLSQTINIMERQGIQLAWDVVRLSMVLGLFFGASYFHLDARMTIGVYSVGVALLYIVLYFINYMIVRRFTHKVA